MEEFGKAAVDLSNDVDRRIATVTLAERSLAFLMPRLGVAAVCDTGTVSSSSNLDDLFLDYYKQWS